MSKSARYYVIFAAALLSIEMTALANASGIGPPPQQQRQRKGRKLQAAGAETVYFSEMMVDGDSSVVVLEAGPFKFEASCVADRYTHDYDDDYPYDDNASSSRTTTTMPTDDDMSDYSYYYFDEYHYTYYAALKLTYTATVEDYLYGSRLYTNYGDDDSDILVGSYSAGESRTQTVFAGYTGAYGDDSTLQSTSGNYATINGDMTIGIHKQNADNLPGGIDAFPEGYDCIIAGFLTVVTP